MLRLLVPPGAIVWPVLAQVSATPISEALTLFNSGRYQECFEIMSGYVRQNPSNGAAHKLLGMDEYMLGRTRDALLEVQRATELTPDDPDAFYYLVRLHFTADNPIGALVSFQKVIALDPFSVRGYDQLGQTYEALGQPKNAENSYSKAIELEKHQTRKSEWPYYNLGLLCLNSGRSEESIAYFEEALARNPTFPAAKIKLAVALSNQKLPEAIQLLQEAVRTDPQNAEGHYRLALLLAKTGRHDEAQQQFALFEKYRKP